MAKLEPKDQAEGHPEGVRLIQPGQWRDQRFAWSAAVRCDQGLNATARLVAHVLAFDFANAKTARCDPSHDDIVAIVGGSVATAKRAVRDLVQAGWIVKIAGQGRGNHSGYGFVTRGVVIKLKGVKFAPSKGVTDAPFYDPKRGQICTEKGSNMHPPLYKDKPYKNHKGGRDERSAKKPSANPMVIQSAERAVAAFRGGRSDAITSEPQWVQNHIIAADLLTPEERQAAGIS